MTATFSLPITILTQPGINTVSLPLGAVGLAYSAQCVASGGVAPYTWTATGLPAGLSISTGGLISGIPTAAVSGVTVVLTMTDSSGL